MTIKSHFMNARSDINRNKMRTWLSMLGIIIGVFSVIVMLAIWNGTEQDILEKVNSMGTNVLTVSAGGNSRIGGNSSSTSAILDENILKYIEQNISNINKIAPSINWNKQVIYESVNTNANIKWVTPDYLIVKNLEMLEWAFVTNNDLDSMNKIAILWYEIAGDLFWTEDPIWKDIKMENIITTVVGVLDENMAADNTIFVPLTTAQIRILWTRNYSSIELSAEDVDIVDQTKTSLEVGLANFLGEDIDDDSSLSVSSQEDMVEMIWDITWMMSAFLWWIAAISLLVGWIWVMNIMLVSVTERIKEIWIRKAIWATKKDILSQFLAESILLSLMWWIIGIALSFIIVFLINKVMTAIIWIDAVIIAFISAVTIGIVFWILPAKNAANLKPIDALRFE